MYGAGSGLGGQWVYNQWRKESHKRAALEMCKAKAEHLRQKYIYEWRTTQDRLDPATMEKMRVKFKAECLEILAEYRSIVGII